MHPKLHEALSKYSTIIFVGWGTGGHVQPIVSVIESLKSTNLPTNLLWIWGKNSQEEQAARENNVEFMTIPTFKISTTRSPKMLLYPFVLLRWILEARKILCSVIANGTRQSSEKKDTTGSLRSSRCRNSSAHQITNPPLAVFSKGWPWSVAVGIAAWSLGIPLYIHESDTIPGRSNRILGKIATQIFLGFDLAKKYFNSRKCEMIWQILSGVFLNLDSKNQTLQHSINWKTDKKHILVICWSQGSRAIFNTIAHDCQSIDAEWIISLWVLNRGINKDFSAFAYIQLIDWISQEDLAHLIHDTDIAITRGSATTLAELTSFNNSQSRIHNLQLIIIPLPYAADNHQYWNAREYEKMWHTLLEQKNLDQLTTIILNHGTTTN